MANSLGNELSAALTNITSLIIKTGSEDERTKLTQQQAQIAGQLQVFVDKVVDQTLPEYNVATVALNAANAAAEAAKKNLDNVADAIKKIADAIDKLGGLLAKLA
jgi:hypothetical protein